MADASTHAVFLSYASQDAEAVRRIAEALRAAGVEVWFDQNELVGGDAWDAKIRGQIAACALFVPVISAATQARHEGYFRLEWKLAAQRTHMMSGAKAFLLPVVIDETRDAEAHVPAEFRAVQWTRLPGGETPEKFCTRVGQLLGGSVAGVGDPGRAANGAPASARPATTQPARGWLVPVAIGLATVIAVAAFLALRPKPEAGAATRPPTAEKPAPAVSDKSLVVLPLENLSPDPENAFFTDGMHAEIISTLSRITDLKKVISRDSAIALKNSAASLAEKAQKVGVAHVITGSVRRAGNDVRISLELRRASDETLLWSQTYNKQLGEGVLAIQADIAEQVARVLQARERRGTYAAAGVMVRDAGAYDLFLQARRQFDNERLSGSTIIATLEEALRLDPTFMAAAALLSTAHSRMHGSFNQAAAARAHHAFEAKRWAETAARLMPGGAGDGPLAVYFGKIEQDFVRSLSHAENLIRALPNEATGFDFAAMALSRLGRYSEAVALRESAITLDPLNALYWQNQVVALARLRRGPQAIEALARVQKLRPPERTKFLADSVHYRLTGALPAEGTAETTITTQLWRMRKFAELLIRLERSLQSELTDEMRYNYLELKSRTHLRLGQPDQARLAAEEALSLASTPALDTDRDPDAQGMRRALALALLGRADEAIAAGRRSIEAASSPNQIPLCWDREFELAMVCATLKRPRECAELLAKLLRLPSDVTVPMLKVDPVWDNVREDAAFKALLADPKNSAPL